MIADTLRKVIENIIIIKKQDGILTQEPSKNKKDLLEIKKKMVAEINSIERVGHQGILTKKNKSIKNRKENIKFYLINKNSRNEK